MKNIIHEKQLRNAHNVRPPAQGMANVASASPKTQPALRPLARTVSTLAVRAKAAKIRA